ITSVMRSLASAAVSGFHWRNRASSFSAKASTMVSCPRSQCSAIDPRRYRHVLHCGDMEAPVHETWQTRPGVRLRREATTVLDDRLKKKTGITNMNPDNLVGKALNPDPLKAAIE